MQNRVWSFTGPDGWLVKAFQLIFTQLVPANTAGGVLCVAFYFVRGAAIGKLLIGRVKPLDGALR